MKSFLILTIFLAKSILGQEDLNYVVFHYNTNNTTNPTRALYHKNALADTESLEDSDFLPGGIRMSCLSGHWLFYSEKDHAGDAIYLSGLWNCFVWPVTGIRDSIFPVGSTANYNEDFVQFFNMVDFGSRSNYFYEETGAMEETPRSLVIAGMGTSITLYTAQFFQGLNICIENDTGDLGIGIDDVADIIGGYLTFRSVAWGCDSERVIKASQIISKSKDFSSLSSFKKPLK